MEKQRKPSLCPEGLEENLTAEREKRNSKSSRRTSLYNTYQSDGSYRDLRSQCEAHRGCKWTIKQTEIQDRKFDASTGKCSSPFHSALSEFQPQYSEI